MEQDARTEALAHAVDLAGSQTAFANATGASQQLISYLLKRKRPLSAKYVLKAEAAFGVSRHLLRPDLYPCDPSDPIIPHTYRTGAAQVASKPPGTFDRKRA